MRKLFNFIVVMGIIVFVLFKLAEEYDFDVLGSMDVFKADSYTSEYIYMLDRETKDVQYEKNTHAEAYPASLTKMMTTLVALENIEDLSAPATIDEKTYKEMVENNASMAGFRSGESVTFRDLLYGTMLSSGGEAANSLAVHVSGSTEIFVQLMNERADEIGLKDTNFTNPEGLHDDNQYTTAHDMGTLVDYALDNGHFKALFTKESFQTAPTTEHPQGILLQSTVLSKLNGSEQEGFEILGGKSGTTHKAGESWATLGVKDEREYIVIAMGAPLKDISNPNWAQKADSLDLYKQIE